MNDLMIAKYRYQSEELSFVLVNEDDMIISEERGILPMYRAVTDNRKITKGASVVDKVVGSATVLLAAYGGVKYLHAQIISKSAIDMCGRFNIVVEYDETVDAILNSSKTGSCPMEELAKGIFQPKEMKNRVAEYIDSLE